jgi:hypothetical protein
MTVFMNPTLRIVYRLSNDGNLFNLLLLNVYLVPSIMRLLLLIVFLLMLKVLLERIWLVCIQLVVILLTNMILSRRELDVRYRK